MESRVRSSPVSGVIASLTNVLVLEALSDIARHPRMAQHSISRPGMSPVTWMAMPPERDSAAQYGPLRSSSK